MTATTTTTTTTTMAKDARTSTPPRKRCAQPDPNSPATSPASKRSKRSRESREDETTREMPGGSKREKAETEERAEGEGEAEETERGEAMEESEEPKEETEERADETGSDNDETAARKRCDDRPSQSGRPEKRTADARLSMQDMLAKLLELYAEKERTTGYSKRVAESIQAIERRLIKYMQHNQVIKLRLTETESMELKNKSYRKKPNGKTMLARLTEMMIRGETDPEKIFEYMRAPTRSETVPVLSKRTKRKSKKTTQLQSAQPQSPQQQQTQSPHQQQTQSPQQQQTQSAQPQQQTQSTQPQQQTQSAQSQPKQTQRRDLSEDDPVASSRSQHPTASASIDGVSSAFVDVGRV